MKQYYFTIKACEEIKEDLLKNVTIIEVVDTSVDGALEQAKNLIAKNQYVVSNIVEKHEKV